MSDTNPVHEAFHVLRIKAGRHDDYKHEEWVDLEQYIMRLEKLEHEARNPPMGIGW